VKERIQEWIMEEESINKSAPVTAEGVSNADDNGSTLSDVEAAETSSCSEPFSTTAALTSTCNLPCWYPHYRGKPIYDANADALGWALDAVGRAVTFIAAGAFLSTALLGLAKEAAGCAASDTSCDGRIYGIRPSSLLTIYTMVVGILSAALMPFVGAIVDATRHRLRIARALSVVFTILLIPQTVLANWLVLAILQVLLAFIGWAQTMVAYAYLPELTQSVDVLNRYSQSFTICNFGSMVVFLVVILGISTIAGKQGDALWTAHLAMAVSFAISCVMLGLAWGFLFQSRPAARQLQQGESLWSTGFVQVYHSSIYIYKNLSALKWFYLSVSFIDAGINSLATIAITYLTDTLAFTSFENGIAILCMLVGSIPGAFAAKFTTTHLNPIKSSILGTSLLAVNTVFFAGFIKGPGQQIPTYILAFIWGTGTGWKWTTDRLLASSIIPPGQNAELMGLYLFSGQILSWLPPLVFTVLNEKGVSQQVGIGTQALYFTIGIVCLSLMGSYKDALRTAGRMPQDQGKSDETSSDGKPEII
jgi:UMF1 family MFS transporter